ncbi:ATP-binding cassette domain-containing protein [Bordetella petrii]|nr:ATP-binding cassette domain-containing protein [Bordetella petrii]
MNGPLLDVSKLAKSYRRRSGLQGRHESVPALVDISFAVQAGEILGVVGESGCGKSTLAKLLVGLEQADMGSVVLDGRNLIGPGPGQAMPANQRGIQMIFQDPFGSLNPRMNVGRIVGEGLRIRHESAGLIERRVGEMLERVGLQAADMRKFPHEFSGGQRQRIGIARALVMKPKLLVADEVVSALDVSVQMQILNLLLDLRRELNLGIIFITHNISVVHYLCDTVAVISSGRIVEAGTATSVLANARHAYTRSLIAAVPELEKTAAV